jgi:transcription antitermination factor NusG
MNYTIGQTIALGVSRQIFGEPTPARWYILKTAPQKEFHVVGWIKANGAVEAWLPTETRWRKITRGKRRKVEYQARLAPGYVFVCFDREPVWDVLFAQANGKLFGVVGEGGRPVAIPENAMARMKHMPKRIEVLREQARQERMVQPGDKARITKGPLVGWIVDVSRVDAGIAKIVVPLLGEREAGIAADNLERV